MKKNHTIPDFHHEILQYKDDYVILSKEGGIKLLDRGNFQVKWEEKINGTLLFNPVLYNGIFYASTVDTFLYSFDLENQTLLHHGDQNLFFSARNQYHELVLAKSYIIEEKKSYSGLFDLNEFRFTLKKELKTGRIFELVGNMILHAGISRDFEINCMNLIGGHQWIVNICNELNDSDINRTRLIGVYDENLIFSAESSKCNYFLAINKNTGIIVNHISNKEASQDIIADYHSFVCNDFVCSLNNDRFVELNLKTWEISCHKNKMMNVGFYKFKDGQVFYINRRSNQIGEYDIEKKDVIWQNDIETNNKAFITNLSFIEGTLFVTDSANNLHVLR